MAAVAVILPTDHLIWSERVAGALMEISDYARYRCKCCKGVMGPRGSERHGPYEFKKAGWKITTGAGEQLLPAKE